MSELSSRLQDCIDRLCSSGCEAVREAIRQLEQGERPAGTEELDPAECEQIMRELKAIMAVYDEQ